MLRKTNKSNLLIANSFHDIFWKSHVILDCSEFNIFITIESAESVVTLMKIPTTHIRLFENRTMFLYTTGHWKAILGAEFFYEILMILLWFYGHIFFTLAAHFYQSSIWSSPYPQPPILTHPVHQNIRSKMIVFLNKNLCFLFCDFVANYADCLYTYPHNQLAVNTCNIHPLYSHFKPHFA